jgi:hypothetical protein
MAYFLAAGNNPDNEEANAANSKQEERKSKKNFSKKSLMLLKDALKAADNYFDNGFFYEAAQKYEYATSLVPSTFQVDRSFLEGARRMRDSEPEIACQDYRSFFSPIRQIL